MSTRTLCLAAARVILAALHSTAPAHASKALPHLASLYRRTALSGLVAGYSSGHVLSIG